MILRSYTILALSILYFYSCKRDDDVYSINAANGPQLNDIIRFSSISRMQLDADSTTESTITVRLDPEVAPTSIVFKTSKGVFDNGDTTQTIASNSQGIASVNILGDKTGTARVSATVKTYKIDTALTFIPALPDDIIVTADAYTVDTSVSINIITTLVRNPGRGKVSAPLKVYYATVQVDSNTQKLVFPPFSFTKQDQGTAAINNPFKVNTSFTFQAKVVSASGDTLRRNVFLRIQ